MSSANKNRWSGRQSTRVVGLVVALCASSLFACNSNRPERTNDETVVSTAHALSDGPVWSRTTGNAAWTPRDGAGLIFFNGKYWLLGGWDGGIGYESWYGKRTSNEIWSSIDLQTWTLEAGQDLLPPTNGPHARWIRRHSAAVVAHAHEGTPYVYVMGGDHLASDYNEFYFAPSNGYQTDVWRSLDMQTWERVAESNSPGFAGRMLAVAGSYAGALWVMGGQDGLRGEPISTLHNDVWKSTDGGATWLQVLADGPASERRWSPRGIVSKTVSWRGRMWLVGGGTYDTIDRPYRDVYSEVWSTTDGVDWTRHTDAPWAPREYHTVEVFDDRLWVIGGYDGTTNLGDVWTSDDGDHWIRLEDAPFHPTHADGIAVGPHGLVRASGWGTIATRSSEVHVYACGAGTFLAGGSCHACGTCDAGTYERSACTVTRATECAACDSTCATCKGPESTNCSSCVDGNYLAEGSCHACAAECATCAGPSASECLSCGEHRYLADGACRECSACVPGTFEASSCTSSADTQCSTCDPSCETCTGAGSDDCAACAPRRFFTNGSCVACSTCGPGTFESAHCTATNDTECAPCDASCASCLGPAPADCGSCPLGTFLFAGVCTACSTCGPGTYEATACSATQDTQCAACDSSCATCAGSDTSTCSTCPPNSYLADGACHQCAACPDGTFQAAACTATSDTVCTACDASCSTCSGPSPNDCGACGARRFLANELCQTCSACAAGTFEVSACTPLTDSTCEACDVSCATCSGPSANECASCPEGSFLKDGRCEPCSTCGAGTFQIAACTATTDAVCGACDPSCASCVGPSSVQCGTCGEGRFFSNGRCQTCSACPSGTYEVASCSGTTNTACGACAASCAACSGPSANECTRCGPGRFLNNGVCQKCSSCGPSTVQETACTATADTVCKPRGNGNGKGKGGH